jgi:very-short-patch-repair endonuclease
MAQTLHNMKRMEKARRLLRKKSTKPEILLWSRLRKGQTGFKFRRQHSIGPYVADFYCGELRLVVEADGPLHFEEKGKIHDCKRDEFFRSRDLRVARFSTDRIMEDVGGVVEKIIEICEGLGK